jgi:hypothetical protein
VFTFTPREETRRKPAFDRRLSYALDILIIERDEGNDSLGLRLAIRALEGAIPLSAIVHPQPRQLQLEVCR